ncbi:tail fiber protein [Ensifer sp. IC3342]|nr:tail fiber protein [Ensifer sp. BRP08]MCA1445682.1 tail fiber protein [Ensifer sp. IC3342]
MPRTGGVYSPPAGTKGVSGNTIQSVPYNAFVDDLTDDANAARPITAGGTGATSASAARTALGAQTAHASLTSISGLTTSADKLPYTTAVDTYAVTTLTAFGRSLIDDADAATARATLGVAIGTNVQAYDAGLQSIAGLTTAADRMIYTTASDTYAVATLTSFARTLLDDASNSAARTTLDVYSKSEVDNLTSSSVPAGTVIFYAKSTAPSGYLKANGAAVSRTTYSDLFAAIGTTFGAGDGSTTFNLPDLRGEFVRGWDDARGVDTSRVFGSAQAANIASHTHAIDPPSTTTSSDSHTHTVSGTTSSAGAHSHTIPTTVNNAAGGTNRESLVAGPDTASTNSAGAHTHTWSGTTSSDAHTHTVDIGSFTSGTAGSGTDTRPRNVALLACIKF